DPAAPPRAELLPPRECPCRRPRARSGPPAAPAQGHAHAMSIEALANARVLLDEGFVEGRAVLVEGERIAGIVDASDARVRRARVHDLAGALLLPGFVDCQVNGGGGVLFNDAPSVETI